MHQSRKRSPKEVRGAIIGTLLGDSYITQKNWFGCEQISENLVNLKKDILSHYVRDIRVTTRMRDNTYIEGRKILDIKPTYAIRAKHSRFERYGKVFYIGGKKIVRYSVLKMLSLEGIALWIMDDGYMDYKKSSNTRNLRICTDSFDMQSIGNIIKYFKEVLDIEAKVYMHINKKGAEPKPRVSFNAKNAQKLISLIYPYFLDEFLYKIDLKYLETTVMSKRCSDEYRLAHKYISQRKAHLSNLDEEDIV